MNVRSAAPGYDDAMTTKTLEATWEGGMRFRSYTGSGHELRADDGESNTAPRPTELVLAGLVMCTAMDVISILDKKRQDYDTYVVHATSLQRDEYPQVFTRIDLVHDVTGPGVTEAASAAASSSRPRSTARSARCWRWARPRSTTGSGSRIPARRRSRRRARSSSRGRTGCRPSARRGGPAPVRVGGRGYAPARFDGRRRPGWLA